MDERWTSGQGDDQPSPPPDHEGPHPGEAAPSEAGGEPPADGEEPATPALPSLSEDPGDDEESSAGDQSPKAPGNPYTVPTAGDAEGSPWSWAFPGRLDDGWGAGDSPAAPSWPEDDGHERPLFPPQPADPASSPTEDPQHPPYRPWDHTTTDSGPTGYEPYSPYTPQEPPGDPWDHTVAPPGAETGPPEYPPYSPAPTPADGFPAYDPDQQPPAGAAPPPFSYQDAQAEPEEEPPRRSRKGLLIGGLSAIVVLALVGGAVSWYVLNMPKPEETADAYADAWSSQEYGAMSELTTGGDDPQESLTRLAENLGVTETEVELGEVSADGDSATTPYEVTLSLKNAGDWSYEGELPLTRNDGEWTVDFSPAVMHPELGEGETLTRVNAWGERGNILAADGSRLDTGETGGSIGMLVGEVGAVTEEDLERLGPAYDVGDPAGMSGLQRTHEEYLAGEAGTSIRVVNEGEEDEAAAQEDPVVLETIEGSDGEDVQTSLDPAVQNVAAQAIGGESDPTALVAIRPSSGEILAVANVPGGYNRALEGQYAPGSSFKIVSYHALLANGLTNDASMSCPETATVGGWEFKNAGDAEYGRQSVTEAFSTSCNTALVQEVADKLDSQTLTSTAEQFGMNSELNVGVPTTDPAFPAPDSTTVLAAQSIGQGQILTSPLHMATVPAAIADGSWRSPTLVNEPEAENPPEPTQIEHAETLRPMMREVVTDGTAEDVDFSGEVHGKTGSAEYGTPEDEDDELDSHAWFVGYKGDVAFAVLVEGGGSGGEVAGPIAADFASGI